jgi:uracil-DNA glycosylase
MKRVEARGPRNARIMIVGEAPGADEEREGRPFVGKSGQESDAMLFEAGIDPDECFITNVCKYRPQHNEIERFFLDKKLTLPNKELQEGIKELQHDIATIAPNVIIAYGNTPLWALRGHRAITSWRGSQLTCRVPGLDRDVKLVPTYHPAAVLRMWHWRAITVHDLRRAKRESEDHVFRLPTWRFRTRPRLKDVDDVIDLLIARADSAPLPLSVDIETRHGHLACIGIAWSRLDAICIPLIDVKQPDQCFWTLAEEQHIVVRLRHLLLHPNVKVIGQNFLYDLQYLVRFWGLSPRVYFDTMLAHHVCFPGTQKGLDYLSSMYCDFHQYWKDEGKEFDPTKHDEDRLWTYNCRDAVATFEVAEVVEGVIDQLHRREQFNFQMYDLYPAVLGIMLRGVDVDRGLRGQLASEILGHISEREALIHRFAGHEVNPRSPKQLQELFYGEFNQRPIINRKTGNPTTDEDALDILGQREPLLRRLCGAINEVRSLGSMMNVIRAPLDVDGKMRCSYNVAGPETFRFSSSENAFGTGTNLQNITSGGESDYTGLQLPNLRRLLIPPPGWSIAEGDLDRADLQVVVWESEDDELKYLLRHGIDIHTANARVIFGLRESQPVTHTQRQVAKTFCHASNYGGRARTVAQHCGLLVHETELMQARWFGAHPGIKRWHRRTEQQLATSRSVRNAFGYVRFYFDRIEECLPEALAWVPQSTVAIVINKILVALDRYALDLVKLLLQVHDSLVFAFRGDFRTQIYPKILPHTRVLVPYPDPLLIPVSFKWSDKSWGDCKPPETPLEVMQILPANNAASSPLRLA